MSKDLAARLLGIAHCGADLLDAERATIKEAAALVIGATTPSPENDIQAMANMILLCGEEECRDVKGYAEKLRALIDGLIEAKRMRPEAVACTDKVTNVVRSYEYNSADEVLPYATVFFANKDYESRDKFAASLLPQAHD